VSVLLIDLLNFGRAMSVLLIDLLNFGRATARICAHFGLAA
jgi:hypothetical protein